MGYYTFSAVTERECETLPTGRPTKYDKSIPELVYWMARCGLTDKEMAVELGITEKTFNNWKHAHPEFLQSLKRGKAYADDQVEQALFKRAIGYEYEEVKTIEYFS